MNSEQEYFRCIIQGILPEVASGQISISILDERDRQNADEPFPFTADKKANLFYIKGGNSFDSISVSPEIEIKTQINLARSHQFYNKYNRSISERTVLATFKELNKPAIIYEKEKNNIYLLFDLQQLVCQLSRLEHEYGRKDRLGRYLAAYLENGRGWKYPTLDILGKLIRDKFGFSDNKDRHGLIVTHDVDRVGLEPLLAFKKIFYQKDFNCLYFSEKKDQLFQKIAKVVENDTVHSIKPIWFFLSGGYSLMRYGNRYSIHSPKAKKLLELVKKDRHSIGLHTSYYAAFKATKMLSEKIRLAEYCDQPITFVRNHYLRFDVAKSISILEKCGVKYDSTIGYPDKNGFRAALSRPFHLWNQTENRISNILELPLLFMDSVHSDDLAASWDDILRILFWVKEVNGLGAFLFHPCFIGDSEEKQEFYLNFIQECNRMNIPFLSADELPQDPI
jgi:hypothetical protein